MINLPVVTALNASTYTPIKLPDVALPTILGWYVETGGESVGYYIAGSTLGDGEATVIPDLPMSMQIRPGKVDNVIFYAKALSGTPNLVVLTGLR